MQKSVLALIYFCNRHFHHTTDFFNVFKKINCDGCATSSREVLCILLVQDWKTEACICARWRILLDGPMHQSWLKLKVSSSGLLRYFLKIILFKFRIFKDTCLIKSSLGLGTVYYGNISYHLCSDSMARWCVFSSVSLCGCLGLCVCQHVTLEPFEVSSWKFYSSKIWPEAQTSSKMAAFRCTTVHRPWFNVSDVPV